MKPGNDRLFATDAGYSILELLIVLVVIAASAAIVGPRVSASRDAVALDAAAYRLASALARTRAGSISSSLPRDFVLNPARRSYGADQDKALRQLEAGIAVSASGFATEPGSGRIRVRFKPDGTATGGAIVLRKSRSAVSIAVDWLTGTVRIRRMG
ncbi:prepilin-type N-terminal cleavage/methylation domain-containing protein [uncultured Hyphomicrobium sp.]|uniref:prepilin-type N-terminal cleavage/methylation domain-containing protein n=1 Tax=uncultured Hyphomicrobium sp. TaxID=194373 RepID=UPI0025D06047|nr:prepilin-type N-terminal cleavage/methylation domain-containing protein [uncultured Hyphomicrobium sp.]